MRKITKESIEAFNNCKTFSKQNMIVEVIATEKGNPCLIHLKLHNNIIAIKHVNKRTFKLSITNCGWQTNTTKERLNGLKGVRINQSKGVWYLNGQKWDGKLIEIK